MQTKLKQEYVIWNKILLIHVFVQSIVLTAEKMEVNQTIQTTQVIKFISAIMIFEVCDQRETSLKDIHENRLIRSVNIDYLKPTKF